MVSTPVQVIPPTATNLSIEGSLKRVAESDYVRQLHAANSRPSHLRRRIFVGPMPEKVIAHLEGEVKKKQKGPGQPEGELTLTELEAEAPEKDEDMLRMVRSHARRFVKQYRSEGVGNEAMNTSRAEVDAGGEGEVRFRRRRKRKEGKVKKTSSRDTRNSGVIEEESARSSSSEDDWDEDYEEQNMAEELIQRWKESEWGKAWKHRRTKKKGDVFLTGGHWLGGSFEIGTLLGINLLNAPKDQSSAGSTKHAPSSLLSREPGTGFASGSKPQATSIKSAPELHRGGLAPSLGSKSDNLPETPFYHVNSQTTLLTVPNATPVSDKVKGKQRAVRYADPPPELEIEVPPPAPPQDVLSRTPSQLDPTSSQAAMISPTLSSPELQWGEVLMRDRMLVRVSYTKQEGLSPKFDDSINRTTRDLQFEASAEFMVVWRKDFIELYEDHKMPGRDLISGHKHLAYIIPLKSSRTNLSVYSFVDLTFCLTCAPMSTHVAAGGGRRIFSRTKDGTNIFIFKHKSRSRSWDWIWQLWRHLGGQLPANIEVHNPRLNSTVTIDIPYRLQIDNQELYAMFTRDNIVQLCIDSLTTVPDWFALVEQEITQFGKRLELCWRRDAHLDWLWLDEDVYGKSRPWATLAGLALRQSSRPASLEIRLTSHAPTHYHLKNDTKLDEPPAIEGYVERIRPNTQTKQSLYLSTHNGLLFVNHMQDAFPPTPPGLALTMQNLDAWVEGLRETEYLRGANQVMRATGICDLRSVLVVRRAFQVVPSTMHQEKAPPDTLWCEEEQCTLDDDEDEGGEAFLFGVLHQDRGVIRMRRCFELLLSSGHVIRFETHSRKVAIEWVNRLRALVGFWKHKRRINAKEEIELAQARRPRLTPQSRVCQKEEYPPEPPADMSAPYSAMDHLYNWCIIDGCNPITKASKIHMRKGLRGQYKLVYIALVAGHLVRFRIKPGSLMHMGAAKKLNLLDAYVISGYYAAMNLPSGQFKANAPAVPRRYTDGLETDDRDEDMLFMLWYRPHPYVLDATKAPTVSPVTSKSVPSLSAKHRMLVFRSRSRIERDAWCWALGTEIEKISRVQVAREERLRDTGNLVEIK